MRQLPPLKALHAFEAASRLGSFVSAAEELHLTPSAISHQIRELEERLGILLFHRIHRAVLLTDAGRRYATAVAQGLATIEAATRGIERDGKSDILTIHSVPSLATQWLMPRLSRFSAMHTDIDVRLYASAASVDLAADEADFDIRYGTVFPDAGVVVAPLPSEPIVVLCAPALARGDRPIRKEADLAAHTLIQSEVNLHTWRDWQRAHRDVALNLERGPRFDRSFMAISAAVDGLGVALESRLLVERELASGQLMMPLGPGGSRVACHCLLFLKSKAALPKMRAFRAWLNEQLCASFAALEPAAASGAAKKRAAGKPTNTRSPSAAKRRAR